MDSLTQHHKKFQRIVSLQTVALPNKTLQTQNNQPHNHNIMEYRKISSEWLQRLLQIRQSGWLERSNLSRDVRTSENPIKYVALTHETSGNTNFRNSESTPLDPAAGGTGSLEVAWLNSCSQISFKIQQRNELIRERLAEALADANKKLKQTSTASTDWKKVGKAKKKAGDE